MIHSEWLTAFVVFAEELNFTRAAKRLRISQPALHVQVRKLVDEVGVPLYERHGRGVRLTSHGEKLLAFGRETGERTSFFLQELREGSASQPLVLAAGEGAYLYLLGASIRDFNKLGAAPLQLLTCDQEGTIDAVRAGRAHVGVTAVTEAPHDIETELLVRVGAMVVLPRKHWLAKKRGVRVSDLKEERLVVPPKGKSLRAALASAFLQAGVSWEPAIEASGWQLILHFAQLGLGLAIVNDCCRVPSGMVGRPISGLPVVTYRIIRRQGAYPHPAAETLCKFIRSSLPQPSC